jgi:hypothetical protein
MDIGLTTLRDSDLAKHLPGAQSLMERASLIVSDADTKSKTPLAGTRRRFVSTISSAPGQRAVEIRVFDAIAAVNADDTMLSIAQHNLAFRLRRAMTVGLAVADVFAKHTGLEALEAENRAAPLGGEKATRFHRLMGASAFVTAFTVANYILQTLETDSEPMGDPAQPTFDFTTPRDALKHFLYGMERAIKDAGDDLQLVAGARAYARALIDGLSARQGRFDALDQFDDLHIRLEPDDFELNGFDVQDRSRRQPLIMTFKKPSEVIGNHIAKYQSIKLAKMLMAYDFDRQLNPFVELGGFLFSFIGDGDPGTGKTTLIQMIAGILNDYCDVAGYAFHYENFGVDQISSYQGKSGQNCKQFISNVMNPRVIGFGTVDDIDQVAAKRADDRSSAGQQEITAVLMESLSGANTVVRGNCTFGMFSNYPENVDDALRQRAGARWLVDGPQSEADYVDIFALLVGSNHAIPLGDHALYQAQQIAAAVKTTYDKHNAPAQQRLGRVFERHLEDRGAIASLADIGAYLHAIKQAEPRFTGRAIKNITDAVKLRAMDIELPDEWFQTPDVFLHKDYDTKRDMIAQLRSPITMEMVIQETNRYADSEFRYTEKSDAVAVETLIRDQRVRERAATQIAALKNKGQWSGWGNGRRGG